MSTLAVAQDTIMLLILDLPFSVTAWLTVGMQSLVSIIGIPPVHCP